MFKDQKLRYTLIVIVIWLENRHGNLILEGIEISEENISELRV